MFNTLLSPVRAIYTLVLLKSLNLYTNAECLFNVCLVTYRRTTEKYVKCGIRRAIQGEALAWQRKPDGGWVRNNNDKGHVKDVVTVMARLGRGIAALLDKPNFTVGFVENDGGGGQKRRNRSL